MIAFSAFDGMSCGQLALQRLGIPVEAYYASEVDSAASRVAAINFPKTVHVGDITRVSASSLPKIDLMLGGSPCQGFSFAGKQLNFKDPRSALFFEFVRLLKELKPKFWLFENVVMAKEHQDVISSLLGVQPIKLNSALVSGHHRVRLYWTTLPIPALIRDRGVTLQSLLEGGFVDRKKSYCLDANYWKGVSKADYYAKSRRQIVFEFGTVRPLTPLECERLQTVPEGYTSSVADKERYKMLGNGWTVDMICEILKPLRQYNEVN